MCPRLFISRENTDKNVLHFFPMKPDEQASLQKSKRAFLLNVDRPLPCQVDMVEIKISIRQLDKPVIDSNGDYAALEIMTFNPNVHDLMNTTTFDHDSSEFASR
jgi:hypothetical protein